VQQIADTRIANHRFVLGHANVRPCTPVQLHRCNEAILH